MDSSNGSSLHNQSTTTLVGSHLRKKEQDPVTLLDRRIVNLSFCLILFLNLIINIDHGVMPAGAISIKEYLGISNTEYGLLGSIVFFGLVLGSLAATFVFNNISTKLVLALVMSLNAVS